MNKFSALADPIETPPTTGLSEAASPQWMGLAADPVSEAVVSAAVLTSTAFRMRDEGALMAALRCLTTAVADLEFSHANDNA